jgi:hypothetical protein
VWERVMANQRWEFDGHQEWLSDVVSGLLINGVDKEEIELEQHPNRWVIKVRGVPKYEYILARRAPVGRERGAAT